MSASWTLRPAHSGDRLFVQAVYFQTQRYLIEALFGWRGDETEAEKFDEVYDAATAQIVVVDGLDSGWMSVARRSDHIELGHLYLVRRVQNRGVGTEIVRGLIEEAYEASVPLRLSTATLNPALKLYRRLGFRETGTDEFKTYLEHNSIPG